MRLVGNDVDNVVNTKDIIDIKKTQGPFVSSKESSECEHSSQRGSEDDGHWELQDQKKRRKRLRDYEDDDNDDVANRDLRKKVSRTSSDIDEGGDPVSSLNKKIGFLSESDDFIRKPRSVDHNNNNNNNNNNNQSANTTADVRTIEQQKAYEFSLQRQIQVLEKKLESLKKKVTYKKTTYDRICKNLHVIRELLWNSYKKYSNDSFDKTKSRNKDKDRRRASVIQSLIEANKSSHAPTNITGTNRSTEDHVSAQNQNVTDYINSLHLKDLLSSEESTDNSSSDAESQSVGRGQIGKQLSPSSILRATSKSSGKRINAIDSDSDEVNGDEINEHGSRGSSNKGYSCYKIPGSSLSMPNLSSLNKSESFSAQSKHTELKRSNSKPSSFLTKVNGNDVINSTNKDLSKEQSTTTTTTNNNKHTNTLNETINQGHGNANSIHLNKNNIVNDHKSPEYDVDNDNDDFHGENDQGDDNYDAREELRSNSSNQHVSPRSQAHSQDKNPHLFANNEKEVGVLSKKKFKDDLELASSSNTNNSTETNSTSTLGNNSHGVASSNDENTISASSLKSSDNSKDVIENSSLDEDSAKTSEFSLAKSKHVINPIKERFIKTEADTKTTSYNIRTSSQTNSPQNMVVYLNSSHGNKNAGHINMDFKTNPTSMSTTNNNNNNNNNNNDNNSDNNGDLAYSEDSINQNTHQQGQNAIRVTLDGSGSLSMINIKNGQEINDTNNNESHGNSTNGQISGTSNRTNARNEELIYENFVNDINSNNNTENISANNANTNVTTTYHHHHHHHHLLHQTQWNLGQNQPFFSQNYYSSADNSNGNDLMIPKTTNIQSFPYTDFNASNSDNQLGASNVTTITTTTTSKANNISDSKRNSSSVSSNGNNFGSGERPSFPPSFRAPPSGSITSSVVNPTILPPPPSTFGAQNQMGVSSGVNAAGNLPGQDNVFNNASMATNNPSVSEQPKQHAFSVNTQNPAPLWVQTMGNNMEGLVLPTGNTMSNEDALRNMKAPAMNVETSVSSNTLQSTSSQRGSSGQGTNEHKDRSMSAASNNSGKSIAGSNPSTATRTTNAQVGTLTESDVFERWGVFFNERIKKVEDVWAEYHRVSEKGYSFEKLDLLWSNKWKLHCEPKFVKKFNRRLVMIKAIQNAVIESGQSASKFVDFMDQVLVDRKKPISHFYKKTNIPNLLEGNVAQ
ncbi:hypothetical protein ACO0QE_000164 [Hanseniaspora vineae]